MGLNIPQLAQDATDLAWSIGGTAFKAATLRIGATPTYDVASDAETIAWDFETDLDVLFYDEEQAESAATTANEQAAPGRGWKAKAIVRVSDLPDGAVPSETSRIDVKGHTWDITAVKNVPTEPIYLLTLTR